MRTSLHRNTSIAVSLVVFVTLSGCASHPPRNADSGKTGADAQVVTIYGECDQAFEHFAQLLDLNIRSGNFSEDEIAEARELKRVAQQLYLEGSFNLALEFINEAITLMKAER